MYSMLPLLKIISIHPIYLCALDICNDVNLIIIELFMSHRIWVDFLNFFLPFYIDWKRFKVQVSFL